jgi:hypothetical protein
MNGVDLANQSRQSYNTQRIAYRIWFPLIHWVFDQTAINAYKLATIGNQWKQGHLEFRRALYNKLLAYSKLEQPQPWKDPGPHNWTTLQKRSYCIWCGKVREARKKVQAVLESLNEAGRQILQELPDIK